MSRHRRERRLLTILMRLGWQRDPGLCTIPCLDGHGRCTRLSVRLGMGWVSLDSRAPGPLYLRPLQVGRLRAALRQVLVDLELLGGAEVLGAELPGAELAGQVPRSGPAAGVVAASRRSVLHWRPVTRPTVADIEARLAAVKADADPKVDHLEPESRLSVAAA